VLDDAGTDACHLPSPLITQPAPSPRGNGLLHSRGEWEVGAATAEQFVRNLLAATRGAPRAVPQLAWPWLAQWAPSPSPSPSPFLASTVCWETHLPVHSLCEHHLLPFHGIAHVVRPLFTCCCRVMRAPSYRCSPSLLLHLHTVGTLWEATTSHTGALWG
jgi:hypothetical protein